MSSLAAFLKSGPVIATCTDAWAEEGVRATVPTGYLVRAVRGAKMMTLQGVFDEFAAALQFPYYFGENKDAFEECLRDLDEFLGTAAGYVVVVRDADRVLAAEPNELAWLTAALRFVGQWWAGRETPVVFRVVALCLGGDAHAHWSDVEIHLAGR